MYEICPLIFVNLIFINVYIVCISQPDDFEEEEEEIVRKPSSLAELKRKQTTAVVLLGVIGAEFGQDISTDCKSIAFIR